MQVTVLWTKVHVCTGVKCDFWREIFYRCLQLTVTLILLSILSIFNIIEVEPQPKTDIWTIKQIHAEFSDEDFYRHLDV